MAKWFGKVGYITQEMTAPSVWRPVSHECEYYGDLIRNTNGWRSSSDSTNDDLTLDHQISIVADQFANQHCHDMRWVEVSGAKWKITKVEVKPPRLILTIGGVWNG